MCAAVYALQVERIQSERQLAAVLIAAGAEVEMPTVYAFDVAIGMVEVVSTLTQEAQELRRELGLSGG